MNLARALLGVTLGTAIGVPPGLALLHHIALLMRLTAGLPPVSALITFAGTGRGTMTVALACAAHSIQGPDPTCRRSAPGDGRAEAALARDGHRESPTMSKASERAYGTIRQLILNGRFTPGTALREEMLAAEIGVSRTPVRDALRRLLADGLVDSTPNAGTFVTALAPEEVQENFELRAILEGYAARKAARRITPEQLVELEQLAREMDAITGPDEERIRRFAELNTAFHTVLARASHSRRLESLLVRVFQVPLVFLKQYRMHEPVNIARSNRQHWEIIEALRAGNADWAALVVSAHITSTRPGLGSVP